MRLFIGFASALLAIFLTTSSLATTLGPDEKLISLLATNDIHGGIEATKNPSGYFAGGFALWAGIVKAVRAGVSQSYGNDRAGVLLVDGGDQFQGSLLSNYNEGSLVVALMKQLNYDAMVPGNHDYDFGPKGWLVDQSSDPSKRREVLEGLVSQLGAPLLAANVFYRTEAGLAADARCQPLSGQKGTWQPVRPGIFAPYRIVTTAGDVRVALIGLDNQSTPEMTTEDNVADLCFADEESTYRQIRKDLDGQADIFILIVHDGNASHEHGMTDLTTALAKDHLVDAVVSAHTHYTYNLTVQGVPLIQSGAYGKAFGRIDLVWNDRTKQVVSRSSVAGIKMYPDYCDKQAKSFCQVVDGQLEYENVPTAEDSSVVTQIQTARAAISPIADRVIGSADQALKSDRTGESSAIDFLTDAMLAAANQALGPKQHVDIALMNAGGIRIPLPSGQVTYEDLFNMLPFNNHGVVVGPITTDRLLDILKTSIKTCGQYGVIVPSGLHVTYRKNCEPNGNPISVDPNAELVSVTTTDGKQLYPGPAEQSAFNVATLDFLINGAEGADSLAGASVIQDLGIEREILTSSFLARPFQISGTTDGRWQQVP